jgi:hypothetical protein
VVKLTVYQAGYSGNISLNVNGIDYFTDELLFGRDVIVLPDLLCAGPIDIYNPCVFTIAFNSDSIDGEGNFLPLFNGPDSDPVLDPGTYVGSSGSGFPPPDTPETLTISSDTSPVPEPPSIIFMAIGLLLLAGTSRRRLEFY